MLWLKHCFRYVTHPSRPTSRPQLKYSMDAQHKVLFFQDHPGRSIYARSTRGLLSCKRNRENSSTEPIEPEICIPWKWRNRSSSFKTNQPQAPSSGRQVLVTEVLECGQSYTICSPNGRVCRRNRAHIKPICHNGTSFQDHRVKKGEKQAKDNSFQDHLALFKTMQARSVSFNNKVKYIGEADYMDTQSMMFDGPVDTSNTSKHHQQCHPLGATHLGHHHFHHQHHSHPESHQLSPAQRTPHPRAGRDTSLNQPSSDPRDVDQGLFTRPFSPPSWNITFGPLQTPATGQGSGPKENHHT